MPVEADKPISGFLTIRRIKAHDLEEAEKLVLESFWKEEKVKSMMEATKVKFGNSDSCNVELDSYVELSWFRWYFTQCSEAFIYYSNED